jgi:ABC-type glycerol-3-phosphate transport system substrate-binding protein
MMRTHFAARCRSRRFRTRRFRIRNGLAGAIAALLTFILAACGSAAASSGQGPVTLTVWSFQGESSDPTAGVPYAFYLIDKNFEATHPGIKIDMVTQPFDNYRPLFAAAAAAQSGPDVWESLPGSYTYQYTAALKPVNSYITPAEKKSLTGWDGVTVPEWSNSGTIYGIPSEIQSNVWYYNKTLFKQAGLNGPPATWAQLIADCQTLEAHGITPLANGTADDQGALNYINDILPSMLPARQMKGLATGAYSWDSPAVRQSLQLLEDLVPYYEAGFTGILYEGPGSDLFPGGHTAMIPGLASNNNNYFQYEQALGKDNVGVFRAPAIPGYQQYAKQIGFEADYSWTVTKWAPDTSAAVAYAEFMTSPQSEKILLDDGGDIPNLANAPASWFTGTPKILEQMLRTSTGTPPPPGAVMDSALSTYFGEQTDDVFTGSESVSTAARNIQANALSGAP